MQQCSRSFSRKSVMPRSLKVTSTHLMPVPVVSNPVLLPVCMAAKQQLYVTPMPPCSWAGNINSIKTRFQETEQLRKEDKLWPCWLSAGGGGERVMECGAGVVHREWIVFGLLWWLRYHCILWAPSLSFLSVSVPTQWCQHRILYSFSFWGASISSSW